MRKICFISSALVASLVMAAPVSAHPGKFKNCTELKKKYPNGVAKTAKAAKATGAKLAPSVYSQNQSMDRDKDGAACESA